jgi:hypothetical protein
MSDKQHTHLTHFDLDGASSEIILKKYLNIGKSYACGYGKIDSWISKLQKGERVIISDVNLTLDQVSQIIKNIGSEDFTIIDHHPSTEDLLVNYPKNVIYSGKFCGAALCYRYVAGLDSKIVRECKSNGHQKMIELTDVYDNWKSEHNLWADAYGLNLLYWHYGHFDFVKQFANGFEFSSDDKEIIKTKLKEKSKLIKELEVVGDEKGVIVVMCDREITNDITLVKPNRDLYLMVGWDSRSSEFSLSVRSKDHSKDLSLILREIRLVKYDGSGSIKSSGGHKLAGGVYFNDNPTLDEIMTVCSDIVNVWHDNIMPF